MSFAAENNRSSNLIKELDNENKKVNQSEKGKDKIDYYRNLLDIKIYSSFRETVSRGYSGFNFINRH